MVASLRCANHGAQARVFWNPYQRLQTAGVMTPAIPDEVDLCPADVAAPPPLAMIVRKRANEWVVQEGVERRRTRGNCSLFGKKSFHNSYECTYAPLRIRHRFNPLESGLQAV